MADSAVRSGIKSKKDKVPSFLLKKLLRASILGADLHLNQAMDWLAPLFNMWGTDQLCFVFE
jgi:hypothetical protein